MNLPALNTDSVADYGSMPLIVLGLAGIGAATFLGYEVFKPNPNAPPPTANIPVGTTMHDVLMTAAIVGGLVYLAKN